jgi:PAS domain S-box-containing protein
MLAGIVASSDDAIVSKDLSGTITSWNEAAERIFGYSAEEAIGKPITMLLPPERLKEEERILATLVRGERVDHYETERIAKDGHRIFVSISVSPIKDASGRVVGGAKIARDITPRRLLQAEREELLAKERSARALAESASRAKDVFLAMVSHELRTPLSPILAWVHLLKRGGLGDDKVQRALDVIERSAQAQTQLIDDLLDISRIISGKLRLQIGKTDIAQVIDAAIEVVRPSAQAKRIRLQSMRDDDVGWIPGDPARLQQVVWNLLTNAIKFTPPGGSILVTLARVDSHVEIVVSDTGRGIASEFLPHIFERFQQAETGATRGGGGLGLGLAIVQHIVERHGGTVTAESPGEGKGATFMVRLPRRSLERPEGASQRALESSPEAGQPRLDDVRVLVVDDEADSNEVVSTLLTDSGADVRVADAAVTGLEELERWTPDVIVSDIGMPGEDGYAFLAKVRRRGGETARIPVIALTAYASTDDRVQLFSAGFQAHVIKPVDPAELIAVVASTARRLSR